MAVTGLKYVVMAKGTYTGVDATTAPTYSDGFAIGAISADLEAKFTQTPLYVDNAKKENDQAFEGGTISIGSDDIPPDKQAILFDYTVVAGASSAPDTIIKKSTSSPPYMGIGFYKTGVLDNVKYYEGHWLYKAQFTPPKESGKTKEGGTSWQTPEISGTYEEIAYKDGAYEELKRFTSEADAIAYLKGLAGISDDET